MNESPLLRNPLFASIPKEELTQLLDSSLKVEHPPLSVLFLEGDPGDCFYVVLEGQLEVIKAYGTPDERLLNVRGPGEHIGEMSFLIPDGLRTATVRSRTPVRLLEMTRETFESILKQWPAIAFDMARSLSQRLRDSENATISELREKNLQLAEALAHVHIAMEEMIEKERQLQESENHFRLLTEFAPFGIALMNDDMEIQYVNPRFTEIFGYAVTDLPDVGTWHRLAFPDPDYRAKVLSIWQESFRGPLEPGRVGNRTLTVRCRDGSMKIAHIRSVVIGSGKILMSCEDITDRRIAEDALRDSERQLRHMSAQLLTAQETERKRIARELHDSVGQQLSAIKFGVESSLRLMGTGRDPSVVQRLETLLPVVKGTLQEVRRISKDLRPSLLDDLGILPTIDWFCREFEAIYTSIRVHKDIDVQESEIPVPLRIIVFRIIQEAFNNAAKHSGASSVRLSLKSRQSDVTLMVEDNGLGINTQKGRIKERIEGGLGLASMKERTELSGGTFRIESCMEKGTAICATWPKGE